MSEPTFRPAPVLDELYDGDEVALMCEDGRIVVLSSVATVAWRLLSATPLPLSQLSDHLIAHFGDPGSDHPGAIEALLSSLRESGVIVESDGRAHADEH